MAVCLPMIVKIIQDQWVHLGDETGKKFTIGYLNLYSVNAFRLSRTDKGDAAIEMILDGMSEWVTWLSFKDAAVCEEIFLLIQKNKEEVERTKRLNLSKV